MKYTYLPILFIFICVFILAAGCTQQAENPSTPVPTTAKPVETTRPLADTVKVSTNGTLGSFLTDSDGITLYFYAKDEKNNSTSACTGACAKLWPPFYEEKIVVKAPLKSSDFGVITRDDGSKQTTFKGLPLYYYLRDFEKGDVLGQGVNGAWVVADADGVVEVPKTVTTTAAKKTVTPTKTVTTTVTATGTVTVTVTETPEEDETPEVTSTVTKTPTATKTVSTTKTATMTVTQTSATEKPTVTATKTATTTTTTKSSSS